MEKIELRIKIIREFYNCFDKNQSNEICKIFSDDFIDHDAQEIKKSLEELRNLITALHKGFSNISHELKLVHLIDNDRVFVRWKMTGKHTGNFFNIPPSNKNIYLHGHDLFKIKNGKISELWHIEQLLSLVEQISSKE